MYDQREAIEQERIERGLFREHSLEQMLDRASRARMRGPLSSAKDSTDPKYDRQLPTEDDQQSLYLG